jgi:hypothetical protein
VIGNNPFLAHGMLSNRSNFDAAQAPPLDRPAVGLGRSRPIAGKESRAIGVSTERPVKPLPHGSTKLAALGLHVCCHVAHRQIALPSRCCFREFCKVAFTVFVSDVAGTAQEVKDRLPQVRHERCGGKRARVEDADHLDQGVLGDSIA